MKRFLLFSLYFGSYALCNAQLAITTGATASSLVSSLIGSGVTATNIAFQGVYGTGSKYQAGSFTASGAVATNLGVASGIVLCTGHVGDIPLTMATFPGASNFTSSGMFSTCANGEIRQGGTCPVYINDVDVLAGSQNYYNAAVLEFDFVPSSTSVSFKYVFGSEEYDQNDGSSIPINYNCSSYNDKFGFIISGPGITGGQGYTNNGKNIARLSNGSEVSINSVNDGVVGTYGGSPSASTCTAVNAAWVNGNTTTEFAGPIYGIQFNGNTKVLTASQSGLTPGSTYHIKLIVTDVNDGAYDSGVFLQAASFTSGTLTLPIELVSFDAKCEGDYTEIKWETASEKNNDHFVIERADEDLKFEKIAEVKGNGNSNSPQFYSFKDYSANAINYYRLVQVDKNGTSTSSKMIVSKNTCKSDFSLNTIYYNAADNNIVINYNSEFQQPVTITVFDIFGRVVYIEKNEMNIGQHVLQVNMRDLETGMYVCSFSTQNYNVNKKVLLNTGN
ncbi:unnamed protein product [Rotaria sp. Silwood2]|nr:unnamed protein product [Rotaria sp. Silwood2]CAF4090511.1 unnamed protein product [Rotaria sp. Silwood2]